MKTIDNWTIVKALNKHIDLAVKLEDNKLHLTQVIHDGKNRPYISEHKVTIEEVEDIERLIRTLVNVMQKKANKVYTFNERKRQDIHMNLIKYNKAFKQEDTLKLRLYTYIGVNSSDYYEMTISKDSARNLYKVLMIAKNKLETIG